MAPRGPVIIRQDEIVLGIANLLGKAIANAAEGLGNHVETLGKALLDRRVPREKMRRANITIAVAAHRAVTAGWYSRLPAKTPTGSEKHLSGYLGKALEDPYNTAATTDRVISFINTELLDREAPHWYRVNYGATGLRYGESRPRATYEVQVNEIRVGSLTDPGGPDPRSWIPKRRYWSPDGTKPNSMFPRKGPRGDVEMIRSPYGARAARFFDLGLKAVAETAPQAYDNLWREHLNEGGQQIRAKLAHQDIHVQGDLRFQRTSWTAVTRVT